MPDVSLLTEGRQGEAAVPNLTLTFQDTGLALDKADGEPVWGSARGGLEEMSPVERAVLPHGRVGVVVVVVEQGRHHRHRVVHINEIALLLAVAAIARAGELHRAAAHGLRCKAPRRAVSRPLMAVVAVAALAALLSAGGARPGRRL